MIRQSWERPLRVLLLGVVGLLGVAAAAPAVQPVEPPATDAGTLSLATISERVWTDASRGQSDDLRKALQQLPAAADDPAVAWLATSATLLETNIAKRELARQEKIAEVTSKLDEKLAGPHSPKDLSEALKHTVELYMLAPDKAEFMRQPKLVELTSEAAKAAAEAEAAQEWFLANELYYRLDLLLQEQGTYHEDSRRLGRRLSLIRTYTPERFWTLRNDERLAEGKTALPPYNGLGEDYRTRLAGIDRSMVRQGVSAAWKNQINMLQLREILLSGVDAIRTMVTTADLRDAFPALADEPARTMMLGFLDDWETRLNRPETVPTFSTVMDLIDGMVEASIASVGIPENAVLHEFGNGAIDVFDNHGDEFSAIIWPDELARFNRMTEGEFRGVGVQIQMDDETQMIKVITPLEGTPAQRGGILAGDLIKKIDGQSAIGITLNQAVDLITGPVDTRVTITMERDGGDIDFTLPRAVIPVATIKGWKRTGAREDDWDWFVDHENRIGYIRLLQFTDNTTRDLHRAIESMKRRGLEGLVLDLRHNPGGLLTEAVSVANTFINRGVIVSTKGTVPSETKVADPGAAVASGIPLAVLINEGSASASEIVSGAIRHYADAGDVRAILIGERTFGKGSVQNVFPLAVNAKMKLTTQKYKLPDGRIIHREPGAVTWGVDPHLRVEVLPDQLSDALKLRQDADVLAIDTEGNIVQTETPPPDPQKLIDDGIDLQLQTALVILQTTSAAESVKQARQ